MPREAEKWRAHAFHEFGIGHGIGGSEEPDRSSPPRHQTLRSRPSHRRATSSPVTPTVASTAKPKLCKTPHDELLRPCPSDADSENNFSTPSTTESPKASSKARDAESPNQRHRLIRRRRFQVPFFDPCRWLQCWS